MQPPAIVDRICSACAALPSATADNAFGRQTQVYRVAGKIFALVNVDSGDFVTLKSVPEESEALRAQYESVRVGYYMNRRHWVTIDLVGDVPWDELQELVRESYSLVFASLSKKRQAQMAQPT